MTTRAASVSL